jgi:hypothetical protein
MASDHPDPEVFSPTLCRRIYARFLADASGHVTTPDNQLRPVIVTDVSVRGAGIVSNFPLNVLDKISIDIQSAILRGPVQKKAEVRWTNRLDKRLWAIGLDFGFENIIKFYK